MRLIPKSIERLLILFFIFMTVALVVNAQTPPPTPSAAVPLDGFSSLLVAAGVGYAARHLHKSNKQDTPKT